MEYKPNLKGVAELLVGEPMKAAMVKAVEPMKFVAEAIAPVETGEYKSRFFINSGVMDIHGPRAFAELGNDSDHWAHVEYGDGNTPRHRVLGRALGAS